MCIIDNYLKKKNYKIAIIFFARTNVKFKNKIIAEGHYNNDYEKHNRTTILLNIIKMITCAT